MSKSKSPGVAGKALKQPIGEYSQIAKAMNMKLNEKVKRSPAPVKGKLPSQKSNALDSNGMVNEMANVKNNIKPNDWKNLKKEFDDLESEFDENLARVYNHGAHKSGVQACMRLIDENQG